LKNSSVRWLALIVILLLGTGIYFFPGAPPGSPGTAGKPNIVLVTLDTTRADHIGCFGAPGAITPNIDSLARDGAVFTNATSVAFGTTPSHSSIMTSTYARQHGVFNNAIPLPDESVTLAEILRDNGYTTAAFVSAIPVTKKLNLQQGFQVFDDRMEEEANLVERRARFTTDETLAWLRQNKTEPFFLWVHYFDPHSAYLPPAEFSKLYIPTGDIVERFVRPLEKDKEPGEGFVEVRGRVFPLDVYNMNRMALYAGEVSYMDSEFGRLVGFFRENKTYDRTMFVVIADHGEKLAEKEHGETFRHNTVYEEVAHVPLVVKLPGRAPAGVRTHAPVCSVDVAPTILDIAGVEFPDGVPCMGISLAKAAMGEDGTPPADRPIFFETSHRFGSGVKLGGYKYLNFEKKPTGYPDNDVMERFYNLDLDPGELYNLAHFGIPEQEKLRRMLLQWREAVTPEFTPPDEEGLQDSDLREKLKELGYM